ncbi:MAG: trypsin-like peptidase domain-containing protein [Bacteroides sp.]|nr:trypsin-like peptidase domain-containing protein [Bacteroides sp.]
MNFLGQVAKTVKEDVDYETKKKYEDAVELEKLRIQAITEIGRAYAANQPKVNIEFLGRGPGIATHHSQTNSSVSSLLPQSMQLSNEKMSGSDIFQRYGTAVFTIEVPSTDGTAYSQGSGFFINNQGLAVSNYHVLEDGNLQKAGIILPGTNTKYSISKVVKANKEDDYVVFIVNCSNNNYIPIANNKPNVGDKVYAIGSPKGFSNTFSSGEVSQWRGPNLMQTTVMIDHGSSGGALINEYGNVVGITSGTFDAESVANLNYAMSIDVIK